MQTIHQTFSMAASDDDAICTAQTASKAGYLTLDGVLATKRQDMTAYPTAAATVAVMDVPRHVLLTCGGKDTGINFTVYGQDRAGNSMTEKHAGVDTTTVALSNNFSLVTGVYVDGATASTVKVGTANACETAWIPLNQWRPTFNANIEIAFGSTANMAVAQETTMDDVQTADFRENSANLATGAGITSSDRFSYTTPIAAWRAKITSYVAGALGISVAQS